MKVISAELKESTFVVGMGQMHATLPGPKFQSMKMTLTDLGVMCVYKGKCVLIPANNFRHIELSPSQKRILRMINWLINKWWDWALTREINATSVDQRAPKVERERHEQYRVGTATATIMDDRNELVKRIYSLEEKAVARQVQAKEAAEAVWLSTGGLSESFINYVKNTEFEPKND